MAKKASREKVEKAVETGGSSTISAVYVGDSANYHIYQVANGKKVVGSLYFDKENEPPKAISINLLTLVDGEWRGIVEKLRDGAREGSKARDRLISVLSG